MNRKRKMNDDSTSLFLKVMIVILVLVLAGLIPVFIGVDDAFYMMLLVALDLGLLTSLIANFFLYRRIRMLHSGVPAPAPRKTPPPKKTRTTPPAAPVQKYDPKKLPDPGLVYRFDMQKERHRRVIVGCTEGTIRTYSTEILDNHLEIEMRVSESDDRDIYDQTESIIQTYQVDLRRGGRVMIYYPHSDRFREMDARERVLIQDKPDPSGDPTLPSLDPKNPIRFQLGDRLRHDGKFLRGYIEFHLFTKDSETETAGYHRIDKMFFLRVYKIFPGYDTAHPDEEGLYPMIDPFVSR